MSVFSSIMNKIFGHRSAEAAPASSSSLPTAPTPAPMPGDAPIASPGGVPVGAMPAAAPAAAAPAQPVDVEAVLTEMASKSGQSLNWRSSIVDLMKLLGLDSSLQNRKELAQELNYTGDANDSATMNIWLHKQVMQKLAANGGKVPPDLAD
ncbi:hypothetical protein BKE38_26275 [Pseudoroseomonas deserti]|uniref:DUF3597 domain-containing protein n=1 Tax=Teichococcus deserti TaxID=1817963 RepID=A0A1V2GUN1_9PROT|nr:DUF3597 domain-containing protein [Pseudoroseomonas deserti]ONG45625.1 hypothetical protein BKE38_26275 [Pseudoroseomonas deserti]